MKLKVLFLILISSVFTANSQPPDLIVLPVRNNTIFFEIFGSAGYLYNVSYDRIIKSHGRSKFTMAIGTQILPNDDFNKINTVSITPQINFLYGIQHHLEIGTGYIYDFISKEQGFSFRLGYRYQKRIGGFFFKAGFTPLLLKDVLSNKYSLSPWAGLAIGWSF
ncbi:MAG: hypothetical protein JXL97_17210 [Bacteroidales bacterium]|nr:hypothetical protein [Bacteroidales bacterium]